MRRPTKGPPWRTLDVDRLLYAFRRFREEGETGDLARVIEPVAEMARDMKGRRAPGQSSQRMWLSAEPPDHDPQEGDPHGGLASYWLHRLEQEIQELVGTPEDGEPYDGRQHQRLRWLRDLVLDRLEERAAMNLLVGEYTTQLTMGPSPQLRIGRRLERGGTTMVATAAVVDSDATRQFAKAWRVAEALTRAQYADDEDPARESWWHE